MPNPRVFVLGATGRIGTILRKCWPAQQTLWQSRTARVGHVAIDLLDGDQQAALAAAARGADVILSLAGAVPGRGDLIDTVPLAEVAIRAGAVAGVPVLLTSSAAVYGVATGVLSETPRPSPVADYGRAKLAMEQRGKALGRELGVPVSALRIGNVAGVDAILGGWRPGFALDRFSDGRSPRRSYIGVQTLARVLWDLAQRAARRDGQGDLPGLLNVAAPGVVEMGDLLDAAGCAWTPRPAAAGAIAQVALDVSALQRLCPMPPEASDPATMVAEWRALG